MCADRGARALNKKEIKMTETVEKTEKAEKAEKAENKKNLLTAFVSGFKNIFNFKTRASKYDYWAFIFANLLFGLILLVAGMLLSPLFPIMALYGGIIIYYVYSIVESIAVISLSVRRLHDTNHSGQLLWLPIIFAACMILGAFWYKQMTTGVMGIALMAASGVAFLGVTVWLFILYLRKGQKEENRFGKPVEEAKEYNKFANIYIILYLVINIAVSALSMISGDNADKQDTIMLQNATTSVSDAESVNNAKDVEKTDSQNENVSEFETPNVPTHKSVE